MARAAWNAAVLAVQDDPRRTRIRWKRKQWSQHKIISRYGPALVVMYKALPF